MPAWPMVSPSDSTNRLMTASWVMKPRSSGKAKNAARPASAIASSGGRRFSIPHAPAPGAPGPFRGASAATLRSMSMAEQSSRPHDQHREHGQIESDRGHLRHQIFGRRIDQAEKQSRDE